MKKIAVLMIPVLSISTAFAQPGWHHKDLAADSVFGVSTEKAYKELLKGKKNKPVIVAVIDSGTDTAHADLQPVLWLNPLEKRNGRDDDNNKYADDVHGWSFLGSTKGNVQYDNTELTRLVREGEKRFPDLKNLPADTAGLAIYQQHRKLFLAKRNKARQQYGGISQLQKMVDSILMQIGKSNPSREELVAFEANTMQESQVRTIMIQSHEQWGDIPTYLAKELMPALEHFRIQAEYSLNTGYDPRPIIGDDYGNSSETIYGCSDVTGPDARHGTHVAGIIAADRTNKLGIAGIADNVKIMVVRAVPGGDERDKDVANAIRYAVDNGASILNMSFGKFYSPNKQLVDEAVQYAMQKDVLIVHAAGNESEDLDAVAHFPNRQYAGGKGQAEAWLEVGASSSKWGDSLAALFSNYGEHTVDVFAPGVGIYSTVPGSLYDNMDGTSMATPVVAGIAALVRSYHPSLSAVQVKQVIMSSVIKYPGTVVYKKNGYRERKPFTQLSISGGIANAYKALQLADKMSAK
jgi:cell wall-associated protease